HSRWTKAGAEYRLFRFEKQDSDNPDYLWFDTQRDRSIAALEEDSVTLTISLRTPKCCAYSCPVRF
ncbi:MAG: hypothetical protein ACRCZF_25470, partial [Gemmataceae bacterium]